MTLRPSANPTHEVVRDRRRHRPGGVGVEFARRTVLETRTLFEVTVGEFDDGVSKVLDVEVGVPGVTAAVGDDQAW